MEISDCNFFQSLSYVNVVLLLRCTVRFYSAYAIRLQRPKDMEPCNECVNAIRVVYFCLIYYYFLFILFILLFIYLFLFSFSVVVFFYVLHFVSFTCVYICVYIEMDTKAAAVNV